MSDTTPKEDTCVVVKEETSLAVSGRPWTTGENDTSKHTHTPVTASIRNEKTCSPTEAHVVNDKEGDDNAATAPTEILTTTTTTTTATDNRAEAAQESSPRVEDAVVPADHVKLSDIDEEHDVILDSVGHPQCCQLFVQILQRNAQIYKFFPRGQKKKVIDHVVYEMQQAGVRFLKNSPSLATYLTHKCVEKDMTRIRDRVQRCMRDHVRTMGKVMKRDNSIKKCQTLLPQVSRQSAKATPDKPPLPEESELCIMPKIDEPVDIDVSPPKLEGGMESWGTMNDSLWEEEDHGSQEEAMFPIRHMGGKRHWDVFEAPDEDTIEAAAGVVLPPISIKRSRTINAQSLSIGTGTTTRLNEHDPVSALFQLSQYATSLEEEVKATQEENTRLRRILADRGIVLPSDQAPHHNTDDRTDDNSVE